MADPFDPVPFDDSEEVEYNDDPVPASDYALQMEDFEVGESQAGNPKVTWTFKVVDDEEHAGRYIWHDTVTIGKGVGMFKAVISAFGYDPNEYLAQFGNQVTFDALAGLMGERGVARVGIDEPDEETKERYPNASPRNVIKRWLS